MKEADGQDKHRMKVYAKNYRKRHPRAKFNDVVKAVMKKFNVVLTDETHSGTDTERNEAKNTF